MNRFISIFVFLTISLFSDHYYDSEISKSFYYPEINLIYFYSPKTGSSFLRKALNHPFTQEEKEVIDHLKPFSISLYVIRNPLYRVISCYQEVLKARADATGSPDTINHLFYKNRENIKESFFQYLTLIKDDFYDYHSLPQETFLEARNKTLNDMDFIIDFDCLNNDLKMFSTFYGFPVQLDDLDKNEGKPIVTKILREYIDTSPEIRSLIQEVFSQDFILYEQAVVKRADWIKEHANGIVLN